MKNSRDIKKHSEELQLAALRKDGNILEHLDKQTEEMCLIAVKEDGLALEYVKK